MIGRIIKSQPIINWKGHVGFSIDDWLRVSTNHQLTTWPFQLICVTLFSPSEFWLDYPWLYIHGLHILTSMSGRVAISDLLFKKNEMATQPDTGCCKTTFPIIMCRGSHSYRILSKCPSSDYDHHTHKCVKCRSPYKKLLYGHDYP